MSSWKTLSSRIVYKNPWLKIQEDKVINPAGDKGIYGIVVFQHESVYVVPMTQDGRFILTKQYRYPLQQVTWEFPCGQTDGEETIVAARRELLEETGYDSNNLTFLSSFAADTGTSSTMNHALLAKDCIHITDDLDQTDGILEVASFSEDEIHRMIIEGEIICPHSIASFYITQSQIKES